ncbi:MAG: ligase-associated DNA damage response exonuclease [Reyranella sp.]|uniref:ligase-associated DNA damage response exonuclease n=1 Tax=Reyranella sp. TaxID=1929291 RepID=UPI003D0E3D70
MATATLTPRSWLYPTPRGLYCEPGGFYIDPAVAVDRAVITHGHGDHARPGHRAALATPETLAIMRARFEDMPDTAQQSLKYGETVRLGDVEVRLAPAGHILGSAQAVLTHKDQRIVVSGDFKRRSDPTCPPFETVPCDVFITEATFALPVFHHPSDAGEIGKLLRSVATFPERSHLVGVYALGKCQRVIRLLRAAGYDKRIWLHGALLSLCRLYQEHGIDLGDIAPVSAAILETFRGAIVLCPPGAIADRWSRRFAEPISAVCSGWMGVRARARQRGAELPLVISDHADWPELSQTLKDVGAPRVWVTHGREEALVFHARSLGIEAEALHLGGRDEEDA